MERAIITLVGENTRFLPPEAMRRYRSTAKVLTALAPARASADVVLARALLEARLALPAFAGGVADGAALASGGAGGDDEAVGSGAGETMVVAAGEAVGVAVVAGGTATDGVGAVEDGLGEMPIPQPARSTAATRTAAPREAQNPGRPGCIVISPILGTLA